MINASGARPPRVKSANTSNLSTFDALNAQIICDHPQLKALSEMFQMVFLEVQYEYDFITTCLFVLAAPPSGRLGKTCKFCGEICRADAVVNPFSFHHLCLYKKARTLLRAFLAGCVWLVFASSSVNFEKCADSLSPFYFIGRAEYPFLLFKVSVLVTLRLV